MDHKLATLNYKANGPLTVSTLKDFTMQISTESLKTETIIARFLYQNSYNSFFEGQGSTKPEIRNCVISSFIFVSIIHKVNIFSPILGSTQRHKLSLYFFGVLYKMTTLY